jgi:hypothetical protein
VTFSPSGIPMDLAIPGMLVKALKSMSRLATFQWIGKLPEFPDEVTDAVASFCPRLRELALPV